MINRENRMTHSANRSKAQVSSALIRSTLAYTDSLGLAQPELFELIGVTHTQIADPDGYVNETVYDELLFHAATLSRDQFFGLTLGENLKLRQLGVLGFLVMNSETLGKAVGVYEKFQTALGEALEIKVELRTDTCRICMRCHGGEKSARHRLESFLGSFRAAAHELTGRELAFQSISLDVPEMPDDSARYIRALGLVPSRGEESFFEFSRDLMILPVVNSMPEMNAFFEAKLFDASQSKATSSFARSVKREISVQLGRESGVSLQEVAKKFAISNRSFQMKLKQEGFSFRDLYEEVQTEFAMGFLKTGRPISEISYALGFSEPAAFQRAFKRWTGQSPAHYRNTRD